MTVTLDTICRVIGCDVPSGAGAIAVQGIASIEDAEPGEITFLSNSRYAKFLPETKAAAVIVPRGLTPPPGVRLLEVDDAYLAFVRILGLFDSRSRGDVAQGIHPSAVIAPDATLGENVSVGPCAVIGRSVTVGKDTVIGPGSVVMSGSRIGSGCLFYPNVTIMDGCSVGDRVIIHAGAVIGSDGFGFAPEGRTLRKIPQIGRVRIEDDVEIGACTCIDRAAFGETVIARGAKLDNLIQVAHNVKIGYSTVIASQTGISGSTTIGTGVKIGGQAGFAGHLTVGDGASVGAQGGVTKDVPPGEIVSGYPAKNHQQAMRLEAALRRLPDLLKTVKQQEQRIGELERIIRRQDEDNA
jgi:UDP-3-O-[3-hydroxymyristoyl] glucosamine N-acyltransferase